MAQVHFVKAAAKDNPKAGIKKGESYYWWQLYKRPKQYSKTRPRPSQLTGSAYRQQVLAAIEGLEEVAALGDPWTESDRDDLVSELENLRDEQQDNYDNMPEGLQQGDTGMLLEERVSALDEWISELQGLEFNDENEYEEGESPLEQALACAPSAD